MSGVSARSNSSVKMVKLGDVITPAKCERAGQRSFPLLSMTMHEGLVDQQEKFKKRVASEDVSSYKVIERGQLVVGFPIDEGVLDFQTRYDRAIVSPAYGVWELVDRDNVDASYLRKFLRSGRAMAYYKAKLRGSTARKRSLPAEVFLALPVFLPSIHEQRRIAEILDRADEIRAKRRQQLAHLDTLTQSIFHEMFLEQESEFICLGDVAVWKSGGTPSRKLPEYFNGHIPWVTSGELGPLYLDDANQRISKEAVANSAAKFVSPGSVMVGMYDTAALKTSIAATQLTCNQAVAFGEVDPTLVTSEYLFYAINVVKPEVLALRRGVRQKNLNLSMIRDIRIPICSMSGQQEFLDRIGKIQNQRTTVELALAAEDELFVSLQSRAFRGEL